MGRWDGGGCCADGVGQGQDVIPLVHVESRQTDRGEEKQRSDSISLTFIFTFLVCCTNHPIPTED